jgi:hypothetical protein
MLMSFYTVRIVGWCGVRQGSRSIVGGGHFNGWHFYWRIGMGGGGETMNQNRGRRGGDRTPLVILGRGRLGIGR